MAQVLRGIYFQDGDFLKAKLGSNPSLTWRSILWGKELFLEGYRWRVANGERIFISQDPWIGGQGPNKPVWVKKEWKLKRVKDLLKENGEWNKEVIEEVFTPEDAKAILDIPRAKTNMKDAIIWNQEPKGIFSVKSAYHLAKSSSGKDEASGSDNSKTKALWKSVWKAKCYPRAKITVWKIINNLLPTKDNLAKKGIPSNHICCFCRAHKESTTHVLWTCKFSKKIWMEFFPKKNNLLNLCRWLDEPMEAWDMMQQQLSTEERNLAILVLWNLWTARNKCTLNSQRPDLNQICRIIHNIYEECKEKEKNHLNSAADESHLSHHQWKPPEHNSWKLNPDASWFEDKGVGGLGWIVRDSNGSLIGAGCKQIRRKWAIKCLEAEAILEGLKAYGSADIFEGRRRMLPLVVESDSVEVVGALNHESEDLSELNLIVDEIEHSDEFAKVIRISKCCRKENHLAHSLARAAAVNGSFNFFVPSRLPGEEENVFWREVSFPSWFTSVINEVINVLNSPF